MRKFVKYLAFFLLIVVAIWIVGRVTGGFQLYNVSTPANEPTLKTGSKFFASGFIKPARFDFVCFMGHVPYFNKTELSVYRVCGVGGDTVEIKDGDLYVNSSMVDTNFRVQHFYKISNKDTGEIPDEVSTKPDAIIGISGDSSMVLLEDKWVIRQGFKGVRYKGEDGNKEIFNKFSKPWTPDNFGPLVVPENSYFVLGDNRHNAYDSRYRGFVSKDSVVATVLWKH